MGKVAFERVVASALIAFGCIAFGCAGLTGCAPQSPSATAVQAQSAQTTALVASTSNSSPITQSPSNAGAVQSVAPPPAASAAASSSDYRVMAGDVLQITVFQIKDFDREGGTPVDAGGTIALPLIGVVPVAGKTVRQIETEITQRLKAKYLQDPQVLVSVKDAVGLRVAVQGAVKNPGVFPLHGYTTLTNVIAQAQGFTEISDKSQVMIIRNTDQGRVATKLDAGAILTGSAPDPQIYGGDTVVVGDSFIRNAEKDVLSALGGASSLGWLILR